jgi:hypothetical protein
MNEHLFEKIESPEFSAQLGIVSGFRSFLDALAATTEAKELVRAMQTPEASQSVYQRAWSITQRSVDQDFENPWDTALACYLWALNEADFLADAIAGLVLECPGCWWSRKLAEQIQSRPRTSTDSGNFWVRYTSIPHCNWSSGTFWTLREMSKLARYAEYGKGIRIRATGLFQNRDTANNRVALPLNNRTLLLNNRTALQFVAHELENPT